MSQLLIVEDDDSIRKMFVLALTKLADIDEAAGGETALQLLGRKKYDAILLDLNMAGVDGVAVLKALEVANATNHGTPVFVITAEPSVELREQARKRSRYFISKPVKIAVLQTLVAGVLGKSAKDAAPNRVA